MENVGIWNDGELIVSGKIHIKAGKANTVKNLSHDNILSLVSAEETVEAAVEPKKEEEEARVMAEEEPADAAPTEDTTEAAEPEKKELGVVNVDIGIQDSLPEDILSTERLYAFFVETRMEHQDLANIKCNVQDYYDNKCEIIVKFGWKVPKYLNEKFPYQTLVDSPQRIFEIEHYIRKWHNEVVFINNNVRYTFSERDTLFRYTLYYMLFASVDTWDSEETWTGLKKHTIWTDLTNRVVKWTDLTKRVTMYKLLDDDVLAVYVGTGSKNMDITFSDIEDFSDYETIIVQGTTGSGTLTLNINENCKKALVHWSTGSVHTEINAPKTCHVEYGHSTGNPTFEINYIPTKFTITFNENGTVSCYGTLDKSNLKLYNDSTYIYTRDYKNDEKFGEKYMDACQWWVYFDESKETSLNILIYPYQDDTHSSIYFKFNSNIQNDIHGKDQIHSSTVSGEFTSFHQQALDNFITSGAFDNFEFNVVKGW